MTDVVDQPWPDVERQGRVLVPVGSMEQHGPHLPLDTDTVIATAVAQRLAPLLGAVVAPAVSYGASGEHQGFSGTISIGTEALRTVLIEIGHSVTDWCGQLIFVNGHGGNIFALRSAVDVLLSEGRDAAWVPCAVADADPHAGQTETSIMLHLDPSRVQMERAEVGNTTPMRELMPQMMAGGVVAVSPNGVLGDPTGATAEAGAEILTAMVDHALARINAMTPR